MSGNQKKNKWKEDNIIAVHEKNLKWVGEKHERKNRLSEIIKKNDGTGLEKMMKKGEQAWDRDKEKQRKSVSLMTTLVVWRR